MYAFNRPDHITLLVAFVHHERYGGVSTRSREVHAQTVQVALGSIGTKYLLDGELSLRRPHLPAKASHLTIRPTLPPPQRYSDRVREGQGD